MSEQKIPPVQFGENQSAEQVSKEPASDQDSLSLPTASLPAASENAASGTSNIEPATAEEEIDIEHFAKVKLRVALVETVESVPKSKKLLKLQVNLGPQLGSRQILSGIAQFYTPEALIGKRVVVVSNLKPAKLMGLESHGMLLAGSSDDNSALAIIEPSEHLPLGCIVR